MEHMTPKGLRQGYFCAVCGESCNLYATGHGMGKCQPNPERVKVLQELNSNGAGNSLPKEPTPTPSITVGTQVRLTGVVSKVDSAATAKHIGVKFGNSEDEPLLWFSSGEVEVIRQPFKRGEVVYFEDHNIACVVLEDEQNGRMLLIEAGEGKYATYVDADQYERRP